jgi:nucleoid-associated protein YgaU/chemotaxis signal transduction protein
MENQESGTVDAVSHLKVDTLLRFRVGPFRFSVPAMEVEGIIVPPQLTVIPLNPPHSKGVFMYHQRLASAISLRSKFGLPDHDDENLGQLILGEVEVGLVGFWVDEVYETVDSTELEWRSMPEFVPHEAFESFAVKEDDIVMATTMQKLYDVPAEQMASMLASMRQNFDLPEDVPPVAAEGLASGSEAEDEDAFGDLIDSSQHASGNDTSAGSEIDAGNTSKDGGDQETETRSTVIDFPKTRDIEAGVKQAGSTASASAAVSGVSLASNRTNPGAGQTGKRPSVAPGDSRTASYNAARTAGGSRVDNIRSQAHENRESSRHSSPHAYASHYDSGRPQTYSGGTYAGSINRFRSGDRGAEPAPGRPTTQNEVEKRADKGIGWLWLTLLLLLALVIGYWLWPSTKKDIASSEGPTLSATEDYTYTSPAPVAESRSPVSDSGSVDTGSQPPVAVEKQSEVAPEVSEDTTGDTSGTASSNETNNDSGGQEVYRLEGEDVTVTVERGNAGQLAAESEPPRPIAETNTSDTQSQPGYREFVHIVVKGDTLWDIAKKYLKDPFRYPELARLSEIKNPDLIYPGDTVRIRTRNR